MRRIRSSLRLPVLVVLWLIVPSIALAQSEMVERARGYLGAGDAEAAYQLLSPSEAEFAGDPDYDFVLGISALDSGRPEQAIFALERVTAVQPANSLARAELARAFLAVGELHRARVQFEEVSKAADVPVEAKASIEKYLDAFDARERARERARRPDLRGYVLLELGYDTNVNSGTSTRDIALPVFGGAIFTLDDSGVEIDSGFANLAGGMSLAHVLRPNLILTGAVNGDGRFNFTDEGQDFDTDSVNGHFGLILIRGANSITAAYQGDRFDLDGDNFRNANGGLLQWRRVLDEQSQMTVFGQYSRLTYPDQDVRDANRWIGGAAYSRYFPRRFPLTGFIGVYGGTEDQSDNARDDLGHDLYGVRIGGGLQLHAKITAFASGVYEHRDYGGTDPFFLVSRDDDRYTLRAGVNFNPVANWTVTPSVEYWHNDSNIVITDFDRTVAGLTVRMDFD